MAGKNDNDFHQALSKGYEQYRRIGTKGMHVRGVNVTPIDELHCIADVAWTAMYEPANKQPIEIDFDVHYLIQEQNGKARIFGWISGNEQELLQQYGII